MFKAMSMQQVRRQMPAQAGRVGVGRKNSEKVSFEFLNDIWQLEISGFSLLGRSKREEDSSVYDAN